MNNIRRKRVFKITATHIKILETVSNLNNMNAYPMPEAVGKILRGEVDDETIKYQATSTFGVLISLQGRRLASMILMLIRYHFLKYRYDEASDEYYLEMTFHGSETLDSYKKSHVVTLKKKNKTIKKTILEL